jgi:ribosome-associated protein
MGELFGVVDAFVITSALNTRHVRTLVEEIERGVKEAHGFKPVRTEGLGDATWVLMDYGDFIVHVFLQETRDYYDLEHLWSGAPRVPWRRDVENAG